MVRNPILAVWLVVSLFSSLGVAKDVVHDPEFVRMQAEFAEQWSADDAVVQQKLAELEKTLR